MERTLDERPRGGRSPNNTSHKTVNPGKAVQTSGIQELQCFSELCNFTKSVFQYFDRSRLIPLTLGRRMIRWQISNGRGSWGCAGKGELPLVLLVQSPPLKWVMMTWWIVLVHSPVDLPGTTIQFSYIRCYYQVRMASNSGPI